MEKVKAFLSRKIGPVPYYVIALVVLVVMIYGGSNV